MKVNSAIVKLVLRTNKVLANGSHPIMLRVSFNGMAEKSTSCSCKKKEWDGKNMLVKKGVPNATVINDTLKELLRKAIDVRDMLERRGKPYTPKDVIKHIFDKVEEMQVYDLMALEKDYEKEYSLSINTIPNRRSVVRALESFYDGSVDIRQIDSDGISKFIQHKLQGGLSEGYLRNCFRILMSLVNFANGKGIECRQIDPRIGRRLSEARSLYYVDQQTIEVIKSYLMGKLVAIDVNDFNYRPGAIEELAKGNTPLFALWFWLFIYRCQGLAPIDCARLKLTDLREIEVGGERYYAIDTTRSKTKKAVRIRFKVDNEYNTALILGMRLQRVGEFYLLPILDGIKDTDAKKVRDKLSSRLEQLRPHLKKELINVNKFIFELNKERKEMIPFINVNKVNYYTARHSYAQSYIGQKNSSPLALASLMGRSPNTLATYIQQLSSDEDLVKAANVLT